MISDSVVYDQLVPDPQVRRELGGISAMTVWRWDHEPERAPPGWEAPVKIGKRNYRRRSAIEAVKRGGAQWLSILNPVPKRVAGGHRSRSI